VTILANHASQSPEIAELCKGLREVSLSLGHNVIVRPDATLFAMNAMFARSHCGVENQECHTLFRQICREAYLGFLISRCFRAFQMSAVPFLPDPAFIKIIRTVFIGEIAKIPHLLEGWITDGLEESGTSSGSFMWAITSLRRTCAHMSADPHQAHGGLVRPELLRVVCFLSREVSPSSSPLATMFPSTLIQSTSSARHALFALLRNEYCEKLGSDVTEALKKLGKEIK
jgi:hypothetical protein